MKHKMAKRIRDLRKAQGLTQSELAARLGVSASAVGMYEQGRREPDSTILLRLCSIFDVSVDGSAVGYSICKEYKGKQENAGIT